jgi:hypothetical protein
VSKRPSIETVEREYEEVALFPEGREGGGEREREKPAIIFPLMD